MCFVGCGNCRCFADGAVVDAVVVGCRVWMMIRKSGLQKDGRNREVVWLFSMESSDEDSPSEGKESTAWATKLGKARVDLRFGAVWVGKQ